MHLDTITKGKKSQHEPFVDAPANLLPLSTPNLHQRAIGTLIQLIQLLHILLIKLEPVDISIAHDALRRVALRQRDPPLLQAPADEDLVRTDAVFLADGEERRVLGLLVAHQRAVCLHDDVVLLAEVDELALLAPRVELGCVSERVLCIGM
jgi:hypothetical protein